MARVTFEKGAKVARIEQKLDNPAVALKQIGALMVSESQSAFKTQSFGGKKWEPRGSVNVFGIIADFHAGRKQPPRRRFQNRPALRDTGRLAASVNYRVTGDSVEVGTNLDYGAKHQRGGEVESKPITQQVRSLLWQWLRDKDLGLKRRLGWLLNRKFKDQTIKATVPKRQFIGITDRTRKFVRRMVGAEIMEVQ